ncbi:MAG TPA: hypothetical protein PK156_50640, partial [Polyangium sp.]|nr:hypothetical protein [Polyangium sp.]
MSTSSGGFRIRRPENLGRPSTVRAPGWLGRWLGCAHRGRAKLRVSRFAPLTQKTQNALKQG